MTRIRDRYINSLLPTWPIENLQVSRKKIVLVHQLALLYLSLSIYSFLCFEDESRGMTLLNEQCGQNDCILLSWLLKSIRYITWISVSYRKSPPKVTFSVYRGSVVVHQNHCSTSHYIIELNSLYSALNYNQIEIKRISGSKHTVFKNIFCDYLALISLFPQYYSPYWNLMRFFF